MNAEELKRRILEIDPFCDINYQYLISTLSDYQLTAEELLPNWKAHLDWWESEFGAKDKKFLKADERAQRKDPIEFIETGAYERDWNVQKSYPRDSYLFPQHISLNQLYDFIQNVKNKITEERTNSRSSTS